VLLRTLWGISAPKTSEALERFPTNFRFVGDTEIPRGSCPSRGLTDQHNTFALEPQEEQGHYLHPELFGTGVGKSAVSAISASLNIGVVPSR
jgi:hypothetical protein